MITEFRKPPLEWSANDKQEARKGKKPRNVKSLQNFFLLFFWASRDEVFKQILKKYYSNIGCKNIPLCIFVIHVLSCLENFLKNKKSWQHQNNKTNQMMILMVINLVFNILATFRIDFSEEFWEKSFEF